MQKEDSSVFVFNTHVETGDTIRALSRTGFDMTRLSLVGKGCHDQERAVGFYTMGDRIKTWGGVGAFWGGVWGLLLKPAVFVLPGIGIMAMAGPVVSALVGALEGAIVVGSVSALGAALAQFGVPKEQAVLCEKDLMDDRFVLMLHGTASEVAQAKVVVTSARSWAAA